MTEAVGVGLLGLGRVGSAVASRLISDWELLSERCGGPTPVLRRVAVRDVTRSRDVNLRSVPLGDDPYAVVDDDSVSLVVEAIGGLEPATELIEHALRRGKTVVTANKAVMARSGALLSKVAAQHRAALYFEAAVGAGLPVVTLLLEALGGDRINSIDAIINGTTNVMLTRMRQDGCSFEVALQEAQRRGFAEADPSSDLDGWDAAYKLLILARIAFGADLDVAHVDRRGIRDVHLADLAYTGQLGYAVKLLAHAERSGTDGAVAMRVQPTAVPASHFFFTMDDSDNAVTIISDMAKHITVSGLGAGGVSTASAVISDIVRAVRAPNRSLTIHGETRRARMMDDEELEVAGYVRVLIEDVLDARELVVQALADRGVAVGELVEKPPLDGTHPQLLLLTRSAPVAVHRRALETLDSLAVVHDVAAALDRIEPAA
jgi:homoserine dehydrogenase